MASICSVTLHGAQFAGDAAGVAAGHQQRRQHRSQFAHQRDGDDLADLPLRAVVASARDICSAITTPLKKPIRLTMNRLPTPMVSIWRRMSSA